MAGAADVGRVEEPNTVLQRVADRADRLGVVDLAPAVGLTVEPKGSADSPAADAKRADRHSRASEPAFHYGRATNATSAPVENSNAWPVRRPASSMSLAVINVSR